MWTATRGYRATVCARFGQRVEVDQTEVRIMGSKTRLLRALVAASGAEEASFGVPAL
jgi:site-specific DNA recombinase